MASRLLIALAIGVQAFAASGADAVRVCLGGPDIFRSGASTCTDISGTILRAKPDAPHLFVAFSAGNTTLTLGDLTQLGNRIDISKGYGNPATVRFEAPKVPSELELVLVSKPPAHGEWHVVLPPAVATSIRVLRLPPAVYEATLRAAHFEPLSLKVDARRKTDLGLVRLQPLPFLSGHVVEKKSGAPLPGATVTSDDGKIIAVADVNGDFREELETGANPSFVRVASSGYGTRTIVLPKTESTKTLGRIELDRGGALRVRIARDTKMYPVLTIELGRTENRQTTRVKSGKISETDREWTAIDLDGGDYIVTISGEHPLQKKAALVSVKPGKASDVDLEIRPIDLLGTVSRGATRVAASVTLKASLYGWSGAVQSGPEGSFEEEIWQGGRFVALVSTQGLNEPYATAKEIADTPVAHLDLVIPGGRVSGRVVDSTSQAPLRNANITLDSTLLDHSSRSFGATADDDGRFTFEGVAAGTHAITAEAPSYLKSLPQSFTFESDAEAKDVTIALAPADRLPLYVTGADGKPIASAAVIQAASALEPAAMTDSQGRVDVSVDTARGTLMMIVSRNGSFALYRVVPGTDIAHDPIQVTVLPPIASLSVTVVDDATGAPVRNAHILLRYNDEFIDPPLARLATSVRQWPVATNENGQIAWNDLPPGKYEIWPYGNSGEALELMRDQPAASASLNVTNGPYAVVLRLDTSVRR